MALNIYSTFSITNNSNGKTFTYAVLSSDQKSALATITPQKHIVEDDMVSFISFVLHLNDVTNEELTYVRNETVRFLSDMASLLRGMSYMERENSERRNMLSDEYDAMMTRMSMITAVIDQEKYNRGLPV